MSQGTLFVVATPIGNYADLTLRAERVLRECDAVVCEERRAGSTLLAHFQIEKPLWELNEHSDASDVLALVEKLQRGETFALISDHGTPLLQDPGADLMNAAIAQKIRVEPIPGASAILAALVASGIAAPRFRFIGRLPQKKSERASTLTQLRAVRETLILLDAPYRLAALLNALRDAFGDARRAAVACNLTMPDENFVRGTLSEIESYFTERPFKGEFVVIVEGAR
jgi:16S rRNA (cytidine1402-2'-O)-methyltransferase